MRVIYLIRILGGAVVWKESYMYIPEQSTDLPNGALDFLG